MFQWRTFLKHFNDLDSVQDSELGLFTRSAIYNAVESPFFLPDWLKASNTTGTIENVAAGGVKTTVDISKRWCSLIITARSDNFKELCLGFTSRRFPICLIFRGTEKNMSEEMKRYDKRISVFGKRMVGLILKWPRVINSFGFQSATLEQRFSLLTTCMHIL
jgi:hypothetical protein